MNTLDKAKIIKLRSLLMQKSRTLYDRHARIFNFMSENYLLFSNVDDFTDHGINHILRVEKLIFSLLSDRAKDKLTPFELFALLSSICFHDIGMIVKSFSNESNLEIRRTHHERVKYLLEEKYLEFQLDPQEAKIIGTICYGHGIHDLSEFDMYSEWSIAPYGKIDIIFLTSLLRLGDLLDLSYLRAPAIISEIKKITGISLNHWRLHKKIADIVIDHKNNEIVIYATINDEYDLCELHKLKNWILSELVIVQNKLKEYDINIDKVKLKTNLDKKMVLSSNNPFIRLDSFNFDKRMAFFGRNKEIIEVSNMIIENKISVLVGESGVGKTSLLAAGVKNMLIENGYYVLSLKSIEKYKEELKYSLRKYVFKYKYNNIFKYLEKLDEEGFKIVIYFDQFEELFTNSDNELKNNIVCFINNILNNDKINSHILLSVREDFLAELWELSEDIPNIYDRKCTYRLKKLNKENAKIAIINTIEHIGYIIETKLVDKLLDDFTQQEEEIYPPYIQIVCHRIFENHKMNYDKNVPINMSNYISLGGSEKIISDYFDEILDGFSFEDCEVINEILSHMITYFQTKQRISYDKIVKINDNRINIDKTIKRLINHRIIRKIESEKSNEYELIHDFLAKKIIENPRNVILSSKIKKALEFIDEHFNESIKLENIASCIDFSKEHFCRIFKKETGTKFVEYVNNKRIDAAKKILGNPKIKISEIYRKIGFSSQQHFTKVFKEISGITPGLFKKSNSSIH